MKRERSERFNFVICELLKKMKIFFVKTTDKKLKLQQKGRHAFFKSSKKFFQTF